jgi:type I restriction enzyme, S subunit
MALGRKPIEIVNDGKHHLLAKADHWERIYLREVAKVQNGCAFSSTNFSKDQGLPLIRIRDIDSETTIDKYKGDFPDEYLVNRGDILVGMDGDFKAAKWKGGKALLNQRVCRIVPSSKNFDDKFLFLCLQPFLDAIHAETSAVTVKHLSSRTIEEIPLPYPPIEEQEQIVSTIEELFSELDKGIEELKTAQEQLKVYRQAVLKWAFEGKLTNQDVEDGELPSGWKNATIGDVCTSVEYGSATKSKPTGKIPVLRMGNIQNGIFVWEDLVYTDDEEEINKYSLKKNDVLFNRTNSAELVGKTAIYKGERPAIFAGYLIRINRIEDKVDAGYLTHYLNSMQAKSYGNSVKSFGVNQSNINGTKLKTYPLPLPKLKEQQQIVQEIESRFSVCDKTEETIKNSLLQANALRQSALKKAFEGKLANQFVTPTF